LIETTSLDDVTRDKGLLAVARQRVVQDNFGAQANFNSIEFIFQPAVRAGF
jgi:hypothetical protein